MNQPYLSCSSFNKSAINHTKARLHIRRSLANLRESPRSVNVVRGCRVRLGLSVNLRLASPDLEPGGRRVPRFLRGAPAPFTLLPRGFARVNATLFAGVCSRTWHCSHSASSRPVTIKILTNHCLPCTHIILHLSNMEIIYAICVFTWGSRGLMVEECCWV